MVHKKGIIHSG